MLIHFSHNLVSTHLDNFTVIFVALNTYVASM